jgi:hypothetical protein
MLFLTASFHLSRFDKFQGERQEQLEQNLSAGSSLPADTMA